MISIFECYTGVCIRRKSHRFYWCFRTRGFREGERSNFYIWFYKKEAKLLFQLSFFHDQHSLLEINNFFLEESHHSQKVWAGRSTDRGYLLFYETKLFLLLYLPHMFIGEVNSRRTGCSLTIFIASPRTNKISFSVNASIVVFGLQLKLIA